MNGIDVGSSQYGEQPNLPPLHGGDPIATKPYVKGHIAPNQFFTWGAAPEMASNFFSNVAPQLGVANHPSWYTGAEKPLMDEVMKPENADLEFYIVTGTAGSLSDSRAEMQAQLHGKAKNWTRRGSKKLLAALPAFWWKAFVKVNKTGHVLQSGGFLGDNFLRRDPTSGEMQPQTTKFASVALLEEELSRRCHGCFVNIFPGAKEPIPREGDRGDLQPPPTARCRSYIFEIAFGAVVVVGILMLTAVVLRRISRGGAHHGRG